MKPREKIPMLRSQGHADGRTDVTVVRLTILNGVPVAGCCHIGRFHVRLDDRGRETISIDGQLHKLQDGVLYLRKW
jgi:hypothetical protein